MSFEQRTIDIYWTVQRGRRFTVSLSEDHAWAMLHRLWAYDNDPLDWTVERSRETVPVVEGNAFIADAELFEHDEAGAVSVRKATPSPHVAWNCPHCNHRHTTDLCHDAECESPPDTSPQVWFCERGTKGIVLVQW